MKNSDYEKKFETLQTNKRELEEEKLNLQKQLEKKNSELNELSTKFNEKLTKLHNLTSERQILENRLVNYFCQIFLFFGFSIRTN
jgi:chromosome segregation ATPase